MLAVLRTKRRRQQQSKQFVVTPERLDETLTTSESFYAVRAASSAQAASVELTRAANQIAKEMTNDNEAQSRCQGPTEDRD